MSSRSAYVVAACWSPLRQRRWTWLGLYGWNADSVWNSSSTFDDPDIWSFSNCLFGIRLCTSRPSCSCLYATGNPNLLAWAINAFDASSVSDGFTRPSVGVGGICPISMFSKV